MPNRYSRQPTIGHWTFLSLSRSRDLYDPRRDADDRRVGGDVLDDDRAGADRRMAADVHARDDAGADADESAFLDLYASGKDDAGADVDGAGDPAFVID